MLHRNKKLTGLVLVVALFLLLLPYFLTPLYRVAAPIRRWEHAAEAARNA